MGVKKNEVVYLSVSDGQSYLPGRRLVIRITRQGDKRTSKHYVATGASRRRMLKVLEAMP